MKRGSATLLAKRSVGMPKRVLRDEVVAAPKADEGLVGVNCRVARDVATGVAASDDQDTLARELLGDLIAHRVHRLAGELAGVFRDVGVPGVAAAKEQAAVAPDLAVAERHDPALATALGFDSVDRRLEPDVRIEFVFAREAYRTPQVSLLSLPRAGRGRVRPYAGRGAASATFPIRNLTPIMKPTRRVFR